MNYIINNPVEDLTNDTIHFILETNDSLIRTELLKRKQLIIVQEELEFSLIVTKEDPIQVDVIDGQTYVSTGVLTRPLQELLHQRE